MTTASPAFRINGGTVGAKASVSASASVSATLDSTANVRLVAWSVAATDETTAPGSYTLVQSGAKGETVTFNALGAGTALLLKATINSGVDPATGNPSSSMTATAKIYVPSAVGLEVECVGENFESDSTYGTIVELNKAIRQLDSVTGSGSAWKLPAKGVHLTNVATPTGAGAFTVAASECTYVAGDVVLLAAQTTQTQNGPYVVGTVTTGHAALVRATWASASSDFSPGMVIRVSRSDGTWPDTSWALAATGAITLGSTNLPFVRLDSVIDVASFGADDSSTANPATNATAINNAITAAHVFAGNGQVVVTLSGRRYTTSAPILLKDRVELYNGALVNNSLAAETGTYPNGGWAPAESVVVIGDSALGGTATIRRPAGIRAVRMSVGTSTAIGVSCVRIETFARGCYLRDCVTECISSASSGGFTDTYQQRGIELIVTNPADTASTGLYQTIIDGVHCLGGWAAARLSMRGAAPTATAGVLAKQSSLDSAECNANWLRIVASGQSTYGVIFDAGANDNYLDLRADTWDRNSKIHVVVYCPGGRGNFGIVREEVGAAVGDNVTPTTQYTVRETNGGFNNEFVYTTQQVVTAAVDHAGVVGGPRSFFRDRTSVNSIGGMPVSVNFHALAAVPDDAGAAWHDTANTLFGPYPATVLVSHLTARLDTTLTTGSVTVAAARDGDPNEGMQLSFTAGEGGPFKYNDVSFVGGTTGPWLPGFYLQPGEVFKFQFKNTSTGASQPVAGTLLGHIMNGPDTVVDPHTIAASSNFVCRQLEYRADLGALDANGVVINNLLISGATNASPIVITVPSTATLATSMTVTVAGVTGNTGANGTFSIIVLTGTTFSLTGSTFSGTYTSGTGTVYPTTPVAKIRDVAQRGAHGLQATNANRPTYVAPNSILYTSSKYAGGQPGLAFNGSQWMVSATGLVSAYSTQPLIIYLVFAATDSAAVYTLLDSDNATKCRIATVVGGGVTIDCGGSIYTSSVFDTTVPTVLCVYLSGASSLIEINGVQTPAATNFNPGTNGLHGVTLGARQDTTLGFQGTIYHLLVMQDNSFGSAKRGRLSKWLMSRIGKG